MSVPPWLSGFARPHGPVHPILVRHGEHFFGRQIGREQDAGPGSLAAHPEVISGQANREVGAGSSKFRASYRLRSELSRRAASASRCSRHAATGSGRSRRQSATIASQRCYLSQDAMSE